MRVTLISHNAQAGDAIGNQIAARAAFFRERGAEVQILVESDRRLHPSLQRLARVIVEPAAIVDDLRRCDLLIVDYGRYYTLLEVLPQVARKGPRILFDYHGVTPPELWDGPAEVPREGQRRRGLVWHADQAVVHSHFMRDELCSRTGHPAGRLPILPLWFEPTPPAAEGRLRQRLGLTKERIVLFVGRLAANKRVSVLIEAVALLKNEQPAVHSVIVGDNEGVYRRECERCRQMAAERGIAERVHLLGHVSDAELADAYRSADVFVMPSLHEGCCIPVLEALAAGVPVIAALAAAMPETIAGAGLSFAPDDPTDLAKQLRRLFAHTQASPTARRIALIAARYGDNVLGGAERSLRLIAETLAERGHRVEVFTTGRGSESLGGVRVLRFPVDKVDESILAAATQALGRAGQVPASALHDFLRQTRQSTALLKSYAERCEEFDACIVGPYGNGLTIEAMRLRPQRTLLVPCFHREPLAQQLAAAFADSGGFLYHSDTERRLAERELGAHHPNAELIGTWLAPGEGDARRGQRLVGGDRPYLLYAGRYCREKNVPLLLEWMRRYASERPGRLRLVMIGGGPSRPPAERDFVDLGVVTEADRADLFAGTAALVQLSTNESLSLAALEAWNEGVPVIAHARCDVLRELVADGGGVTAADYDQFRNALDDWHREPESWAARGRAGRDMVRARYGSRELFADRIAAVLAGLDRPLADIMRARGREVTAPRTPQNWQRAFAERVDSVLHSEPIDPPAAIPREGDVRLGARLADAATLVELPVGYEDVSEGPLARWKRAVKRKLLHQFQASYIDILSRQQTELNRALLSTIRELAERVESLEHRLDTLPANKPTATSSSSGAFGLPLHANEDMEVSQ